MIYSPRWSVCSSWWRKYEVNCSFSVLTLSQASTSLFSCPLSLDIYSSSFFSMLWSCSISWSLSTYAFVCWSFEMPWPSFISNIWPLYVSHYFSIFLTSSSSFKLILIACLICSSMDVFCFRVSSFSLTCFSISLLRLESPEDFSTWRRTSL